jgi:hypothetical protein
MPKELRRFTVENVDGTTDEFLEPSIGHAMSAFIKRKLNPEYSRYTFDQLRELDLFLITGEGQVIIQGTLYQIRNGH